MQKPSRPNTRFLPRGLAILYEDRDILVADKPSGLLTMGTDREKTRTVYFALTDYVRKGAAKSRDRIFILHRLDRETSGVLVFAKTEEAKFGVQGRWDETKKLYLAVVHGKCEKRAETIATYLAENSAHGVYSTSDAGQGKLSHTAYRVLKETKNFTLLAVELLTGRKHQIRVHLADAGHPVVGDKRYGRGQGAQAAGAACPIPLLQASLQRPGPHIRGKGAPVFPGTGWRFRSPASPPDGDTGGAWKPLRGDVRSAAKRDGKRRRGDVFSSW